jgi:hypothetical protein
MSDLTCQTEDREAILARLGEFGVEQLRDAFPHVRHPYASKGKARPEPEPRPDPPAGLSPEALVVHWIDELLEGVAYLRDLEAAFAKFARPMPYEHGEYLTIGDCDLPARWRGRFQGNAHDPARIRSEVNASSLALAEAIRATSPGAGSAQFVRFIDSRDGRTWVALPDDSQLDPERVTFDLVDLEDNPIAWTPWITAIAVFAPGQPIRFLGGWIWPQEGLAYSIGDDGTATLVEGDAVDDDAGDDED